MSVFEVVCSKIQIAFFSVSRISNWVEGIFSTSSTVLFVSAEGESESKQTTTRFDLAEGSHQVVLTAILVRIIYKKFSPSIHVPIIPLWDDFTINFLLPSYFIPISIICTRNEALRV